MKPYPNLKVNALISGQTSIDSTWELEDFAALAMAALDQAGVERADQNTVSKLLAEYDLESDEMFHERTGEPRGAGRDPHGRTAADFAEND